MLGSPKLGNLSILSATGVNAHDVELIAVEHYEVSERDGTTWLSFADAESTKFFRQAWIIRRRPRPIAPSFCGAPVPRTFASGCQRSAPITMSDFHPWTLRRDDAEDPHVRHPSPLRGDSDSWAEALIQWLDGNVLSSQAARYFCYFLCVHRMRPRDETEDVRSDEDFDDEELHVDNENVEEDLQTEMGGQDTTEDVDPETALNGKATQEQTSRSGMAIAHAIWKTGVDPENATAHDFDRPDTIDDTLDEAKESRKCEITLDADLAKAARDPQLNLYDAANNQDVRNWLNAVKVQKNEKGCGFLNTTQFEMVKRVANQICLDNEHNPQRHHMEPLRWSLHGGPDTGKSHVLKVIKEG